MMPRLHIALVHYHARRGGVTTVMGHAARVLSDASHRVVVLVGEPPSDDPPPGTIVSIVHGLGYYRGGRPVRADALVERMERAAAAGLGRRPDLWHVHNHALGKNPALTEALSLLALRGHRLLLQIHDFAEDGRPAL